MELRLNNKAHKSLICYVNKKGELRDADIEFASTISGKDRDFFERFLLDAEVEGGEGKTSWGKDRRNRRNNTIETSIKNRSKGLSMSKYNREMDIMPTGPVFVDLINHKIDMERGVLEENDLMVGVIRTNYGYKCSRKFNGVRERSYFLLFDTAKAWVSKGDNYED